MTLAVVGADYPNKRGPGRRFEIALCRPGDPVELVPEPKNPVDPRAVQVVSERGVVMGYLRAERAPWIGGMLRSGVPVRAIFQEASNMGAFIRATFDDSEPTLPATKPPANRTQDWWPDEIPPDD